VPPSTRIRICSGPPLQFCAWLATRVSELTWSPVYAARAGEAVPVALIVSDPSFGAVHEYQTDDRAAWKL
jgi:hypothetical protein